MGGTGSALSGESPPFNKLSAGSNLANGATLDGQQRDYPLRWDRDCYFFVGLRVFRSWNAGLVFRRCGKVCS